MAFWTALAVAFGVVFLAEFADKTQLVLLTLAARGKAWRVWLGAAAAFLVLTVAAAAAGELLSRVVPGWTVRLVAGLAFIGFGAWGLLHREDEATPTVVRTGFAPAFTLMLLAELGDKTQLAVAALAADSGTFVATALGGTLALWTSAALAVLAGGWIGRKVPTETLERVAGWLFIGLGVLLLTTLVLPITII